MASLLEVHLDTNFILDARRRIVSTREPHPLSGPIFTLIRDQQACSWAIHADVPEDIAEQVNSLAAHEPPLVLFDDPPLHMERYRKLLNGRVQCSAAFRFPEVVPNFAHVESIDSVDLLHRHFQLL